MSNFWGKNPEKKHKIYAAAKWKYETILVCLVEWPPSPYAWVHCWAQHLSLIALTVREIRRYVKNMPFYLKKICNSCTILDIWLRVTPLLCVHVSPLLGPSPLFDCILSGSNQALSQYQDSYSELLRWIRLLMSSRLPPLNNNGLSLSIPSLEEVVGWVAGGGGFVFWAAP